MTVLVRYPSLDILVVMDTMASDQIYSVGRNNTGTALDYKPGMLRRNARVVT